MTLYLSRLSIARNPTANAIRALIDPPSGPERDHLSDPAQARAMDAHHRLIWSLFADHSDRRRDFLWRSEGKGRFLVLSDRVPAADGAGLFDPPQTKEFAPDLATGDRLHFLLRVNATRARKNSAEPKRRGMRVDVVMDGLHHLPSGHESDARRDARMDIAQETGRAWLDGQGTKSGFTVEAADVTDYSVVSFPGPGGSRPGRPRFGVMDITGQLCVTDPALLLAGIGRGFGRAKAFGCGLMLIRRA